MSISKNKPVIYYLENRGWVWIYHFLVYSIGGLHKLPTQDTSIILYIPYMKKDILQIDKDYIAKLTGKGSYEIDFPYMYGGSNFSFNTADINYEIMRFIEPEFKFIDTIDGIDIENYDIKSFIGEEGSNCRVPDYTHVYLRNLFLSKMPTMNIQPGKRIYITRKNSDKIGINNGVLKRHVMNESELMDTLTPLNFTYIHLEDLNLQEKIELFQTSEIVISPNSGGLTFSNFANKNTTVIELMPEFHLGQYGQEFLQEQFLDIGKAIGIDLTRFRKMRRVEHNLNMEVDVDALYNHVQTIIHNKYTKNVLI